MGDPWFTLHRQAHSYSYIPHLKLDHLRSHLDLSCCLCEHGCTDSGSLFLLSTLMFYFLCTEWSESSGAMDNWFKVVCSKLDRKMTFGGWGGVLNFLYFLSNLFRSHFYHECRVWSKVHYVWNWGCFFIVSCYVFNQNLGNKLSLAIFSP